MSHTMIRHREYRVFITANVRPNDTARFRIAVRHIPSDGGCCWDSGPLPTDPGGAVDIATIRSAIRAHRRSHRKKKDAWRIA